MDAKNEALRNLRFEHEALTLALEGGNTYAWCFDGKTAVLDQAFCELTNRSQNLLGIEEIAHYVHPDEQARFRKNRIQHTTPGNEEQPNTVANSTTPVTNGGNSDTACCRIMNKILSSPDFW